MDTRKNMLKINAMFVIISNCLKVKRVDITKYVNHILNTTNYSLPIFYFAESINRNIIKQL